MEPICRYFKDCGGCTSQHIPYELQLENKRGSLEARLRKKGISSAVSIHPSTPYNYRSRMDFIFFSGGIGLRRKGRPGRFIPVRECSIACPKINTILGEVWKSLGHINNGSVILRQTTLETSALFMFSPGSDLKRFAKETSADNVVASFDGEIVILKGSDRLSEAVSGYHFCFPCNGFFQNNVEIAKSMVDHIRSLVDEIGSGGSSLLDLYGGVGLFGISLAEKFNQVLIVDSFSPGISCAQENIQANSIKNAKAMCMDASRLDHSGFVDHLIVIDPPRSGMDQKVLRFLVDANPKAIFYVSCNPEELVKDLLYLKKSFDVRSVSMFDMFPQTNHVETVVCLTRKF